MDYLKVGSEIIEYELRKSSKAKRINITIRESKVKVSVPSGFTFDYARNFIEANKEWVYEHVQKQKTLRQSIIDRNYTNGEKFLYRGRHYPLNIIQNENIPPQAAFQGSRIIVYIPGELSDSERCSLIKNLIEDWYKKQAELILPEIVEFYSKAMNIPYEKLKIKNQKTRWGSCSSKGNINLNWKIIMGPNQVIAYVIIHELSHLKHMNHSSDFWQTVETYFPEYKKWKKWLSENGRFLLAVD